MYPISPFGLATNVRGKETKYNECLKLISSSGESYIDVDLVTKNTEIINNYKVIIGQLNPDRAGVNNSKDGMINVTTKIRILEPNVVNTATYILLNSFKIKTEAQNFQSYVATKFVRYLVSLTLASMHITRDSFKFVPNQNFKESWTDEKLFKKYKLTESEIELIESMIRPMDITQNTEVDE